MPGRGGGRRSGADGHPHDPGGRAGKSDGGVGMGVSEGRGHSEWAPGQQKTETSGSARELAPGHGGEPPGQQRRDATENATETPELDSFDREG